MTIAMRDPGTETVTGLSVGYTPRKRTVQLGTALMTGATIMYFAGLFGVYISTRNTHLTLQRLAEANGESVVPWIPSTADVQLTAPTVMTWTLLMSLPIMQWAVYAFKRNDRRHALIALATTALLGAAVINQVSFQWRQLGLVIDDVTGTAAATLIYTITASHVLMIAVALVLLALAAFRAFASADISPYVDHAASAAVFWYAMVGLYFVIWILIFITK